MNAIALILGYLVIGLSATIGGFILFCFCYAVWARKIDRLIRRVRATTYRNRKG